MPEKWERLSESLALCTSELHTFGTDAYLLAGFASPKGGALCCDLGSGCGVIPMLWLSMENPPKKVYAIEIMPDACALMQRSVQRAGLEDSLLICNQDLRCLPDDLPFGRLELVACNPPYFAPGTGRISRDSTRRSARHEGDACTLSDVCAAAARLLKYGGRFSLCHRPERLPDVLEAMRAHSLEPKRLRFVQERPEKAPWLILAEGRKGGRPGLRVEPPLLMKTADGRYTEEIYEIYNMPNRHNNIQEVD